MKSVVITVLVFLSVFVSAQNQKLTAIVKDSKTGEALPYCNVLVVGTNKGTITNAEQF